MTRPYPARRPTIAAYIGFVLGVLVIAAVLTIAAAGIITIAGAL